MVMSIRVFKSTRALFNFVLSLRSLLVRSTVVAISIPVPLSIILFQFQSSVYPSAVAAERFLRFLQDARIRLSAIAEKDKKGSEHPFGH
jgi:hypothetical protein